MVLDFRSLIFFTFFILVNSSSFAQMEAEKFDAFTIEVTRLMDENELNAAISLATEFRIKNYSSFDCKQKGKVSEREGIAYYGLYDDSKAVEFWIDSTAFYWNDCEGIDKESWAKLYYNAGNTYSYLNDDRKAAKYLSKSLDLFNEIPVLDEERFAERQLELAGFYLKLGDTYNAELMYSLVQNKLDKIDSENILAEYHSALVYHNSILHEHEEVIKNGLISTSILLLTEEKSKDNLITEYLNMSYAYYNLNNQKEALNYLLKIEELYKKYNTNFKKSEYINQLPLVLAKSGRQEEAIEIYKTIINEYKLEGESKQKNLSYAYENLGDIYKRLEKYSQADSLYLESSKFYLPKSKKIPADIFNKSQTIIFPQNLISTLSNKAHNKILHYTDTKKSELLEDAKGLYEAIDFLFERERSMINQFEQKAVLSDQVKSHLNQAVDGYYFLFKNTNQIEYLEEAYRYASVNKSLLMRESINLHQFIAQNDSDSLLLKEEEILNKINETYQAIEIADFNNNLDSLNTCLISYRREKESFFKYVKTLYNRGKQNSNKFETLSLANIQQELSEGEILIDYYFTKKSLYVFAISKNQISGYSIKNEVALINQIKSFRSNILKDELKDKGYSNSIYDLLIGSILKEIQDSFDHIYIIPDEILLKMPFEALRNNNEYLIERVSVSYLNANSDLKKSAGIAKNNDYLGLGSSYTNNLNEHFASKVGAKHLPLKQLLNANSEINESARFWKAQIFLNDEASKENFINCLSNASIVHIALHGLLDDRHPEHSAIAFDDRNEESILNTNELYSLPLSNQLAILSTCSSGEGEIYKSEGSQSLARGFAIAGCPSILSSLWAVYDKPTSTIIGKFNELLSEGKPKHKALQEAKLFYLESAFATKRSPKYWSNLVLTGNVDPIVKSKGKNILFLIFAVLILLVMGYIYYTRKLK